eukprot:gene13864-19787_t
MARNGSPKSPKTKHFHDSDDECNDFSSGRSMDAPYAPQVRALAFVLHPIRAILTTQTVELVKSCSKIACASPLNIYFAYRKRFFKYWQAYRNRVIQFAIVVALLLGLVLGFSRFQILQARISHMNAQIRELNEQLHMLKTDRELVPKDEERCCLTSESYMAKAARLDQEVQSCQLDANKEHDMAGSCASRMHTCSESLLKITTELEQQSGHIDQLKQCTLVLAVAVDIGSFSKLLEAWKLGLQLLAWSSSSF